MGQRYVQFHIASYLGRMNPRIFSTLLLLVPMVVCCQSFMDDFSDGELHQNPSWLGDTSLFRISAGELQLYDTAPASNGTASLTAFAPTSLDVLTTWEVYIRLQFAPSPSNFARFYLLSDSPDLEGPLNGYFIRIGGISGDADAIELYRQTGQQTQLLISCDPGAVALEPAVARLRISRDTIGMWQLSADYAGGQNFTPQGIPILDTIHPRGDWTGIYCRYSASRAQAFFWDDIRIAPLYEDASPPLLAAVEVIDSRRIYAVFNEALDTLTASIPDNYALSLLSATPVLAQPLLSQPNKVFLEWDTPMENLANYYLSCQNISDIYGNSADTQIVAFTFYDIQPPQPGDLLITEFMADPDPVVSVLPPAEYVEIYNAGNKVIDLSQLQFSAGGTSRFLSGGLLLPGEYAIICASDAGFLPEVAQATLVSFPTLGNTSGTLKILDNHSNILVEVNYSSEWYGGDARGDGGWSLELVELDKYCDCPSNWRVCSDPQGGTPGTRNSVADVDPDRTGPVLTAAIALHAERIQLAFDKVLHAESLTPDLFVIREGISIFDVLLREDRKTLWLELSEPLLTGQTYLLEISGALRDCLGNPFASAREVRLGLPEPVNPGDIIINEVLFNPVSGGRDFIELYNVSRKILQIKGLHIWNLSRPGNSFVQIQTDWAVFPGEYVVLTADKADLLARYPDGSAEHITAHPLPVMDDDEGNVTLRNGVITIDSMDYSETWHSPLLQRVDGVSLERLDPASPSGISGNWHSAAQTVGFATPGYQNSQFRDLSIGADRTFFLLSETVTPDGDGESDVLSMIFRPEQQGALLTVLCYDISGRLVRTIARNTLCGFENLLKWDASDESGMAVRGGFYLIRATWLFPDGNRGKFQGVIVVGR